MKKQLKHVAIIMDGNGRWAKQRNLPVFSGHKKGMDRLDDILEVAKEQNIKYVTVYAFSKENWQRSEEEVSGLLKLIRFFYQKGFKRIIKDDVKVNILGERKNIPKDTLEIMDSIVYESFNNKGIVFNIAFNYSSRDEILRACTKMMSEDGCASIEGFEKHLYTAGMPDVDLLIRTSGEQRISNFLLWQISYSELVFSEVFWPDFDKNEFVKCIDEYYLRDRRFGKR